MERNDASLALYLREHPILKETSKTKREKYIDLLDYYPTKTEMR